MDTRIEEKNIKTYFMFIGLFITMLCVVLGCLATHLRNTIESFSEPINLSEQVGIYSISTWIGFDNPSLEILTGMLPIIDHMESETIKSKFPAPNKVMFNTSSLINDWMDLENKIICNAGMLQIMNGLDYIFYNSDEPVANRNEAIYSYFGGVRRFLTNPNNEHVKRSKQLGSTRNELIRRQAMMMQQINTQTKESDKITEVEELPKETSHVKEDS
tara:strand:+ start:323 stop:970 length:648 start_codon:yes stop_codon:yes gene_type:complete